jgi:hypothetical protein
VRARLLARLVVLLVAAGIAGCGGGDDGNGDANGTVATQAPPPETTNEALPTGDRVLQDGDLDGFFAGVPREWGNPAAFAREYRLVGATQLSQKLRANGFVDGAGNALTAADDDAQRAVSFAVQLGSRNGAADTLEWIYGHASVACPPGCGVEARPFSVGIPRARGVVLRAEETTELGPPFEAHRVFFVEGPFMYTIAVHAPPGAVSRTAVMSAARALRERVEGRPAG